MNSRSHSKIIVVRGAGDLATGTIHRLCRAGFRVLALETEHPMAIRRHVAFSEAVVTGEALVEGIRAVRVDSVEEARRVWESGENMSQDSDLYDHMLSVPVMVDPGGSSIKELSPFAVVDAILAKKNLGTHRGMAPLTIALGPGFTAGEDVDYVIETMRGHNLGRIIRNGQAKPNTGVPGIIGGFGAERVIHAPAAGVIHVIHDIGDTVQAGQVIAVIEDDTPENMRQDTESAGTAEEGFAAGRENRVTAGKEDRFTAGTEVRSQITGLLRGMIRDGTPVHKGLKIADVDPRKDQYRNCFTISDKARCIAGSVLEIICAAMLGLENEPAVKVGCVLMAAGWSRRFVGADKLLAEVDRRPLICRILRQMRELADALPEAEPHVIARRAEIADLAREYGIACTLYEGGVQSDTVRKALELPGAEHWAGCMFIPADQPLLTAGSMEMLLRAFLQSPQEIHRLCADGVPGNPVLFPASCFSDLRKLQGDVGGREVIRRGKVPVRMHETEDKTELLDVDLPRDLERIISENT